MQLTKQTDFSLRVLIYLAQFQQPCYVQIQELCDYFDISANHLSKVVVRLSRMGLIETRRGKGGGITLAMEPEQINLAEVVRGTENQLKVVNCQSPICRISPDCSLKGILDEAVNAFLDHLAGYTLADLIIPETRFEELRTLTVQELSQI